MTRWLSLALLSLAACAPANDEPPAETASAAAATPVVAPPRLALLTPADYEAQPLSGELACSFTADGGTLLAMRGNVAGAAGWAEGLIKIGDRRLRGRSEERGGYDPLPDGTRFSTEEATILVELTSNVPLDGGESPPLPARLTARWPNGTERTYTGTWTCGP